MLELPERVDAAIAKRRGLGRDHCGDDLPDMRKLQALLSEVEEVARACGSETRQRVRYELLDVAVCAVLWASCEPTGESR
jgi:NTP pyrophosphatase (non-canonical NTP hydrolase)